jgi:hypothetical protein
VSYWTNQRSGADLPRIELLRFGTREEFLEGGEIDGSIAVDHRLRSVQFRARFGPVLVPEQFAKVYRSVRAEGENI